MKMLIGFLFIGMLVSEAGGIYARLKFEQWSRSHRASQGMPMTWDLRLAELLERPVETLIEVNQELWEN